MNTRETYGPEDLEYLLANKHFSELYAEEKEYVLQHIENEAEYDELRKILLQVEEPELLEVSPSSRLKDELMHVHRDHHKKPSFKIWLNSLFEGFSFHDLVRKPAFQFATVAGILIIGWSIMPSENTTDLAEHSMITEDVDIIPLEKEIEMDSRVDSKIEAIEEEAVSIESEDLSVGLKESNSSPAEPEIALDDLDYSNKTSSDAEIDQSIGHRNESVMDVETSLEYEEMEMNKMDVLIESDEVEDSDTEPLSENSYDLSSPSAIESAVLTEIRNQSKIQGEIGVTPNAVIKPAVAVTEELIHLLYTSW